MATDEDAAVRPGDTNVAPGATGGSRRGTPGSASSTAKYSAPAAACAAQILLTLAHARAPLTLAELAQRTGCSKSLTFRVIRELELVHLVYNPGGRGYRLASAILEFSDAVAHLSATEAMREILLELSNETGQTVNVGVLRGFDVLITAKQNPPRALVSVTYVGARVPANCSALGKVLLAELTQEELRSRLPERLEALTSKSSVDPVALEAELEQVRADGWAIDFEGAIRGRFAMAVPLTMPEPDVNAALAVTGSLDDYSEEYREFLHGALVRTVQRIERTSSRAEAG